MCMSRDTKKYIRVNDVKSKAKAWPQFKIYSVFIFLSVKGSVSEKLKGVSVTNLTSICFVYKEKIVKNDSC